MEIPYAASMEDVNHVIQEMRRFMETQFQALADRHKKLEQRMERLEERLQNTNTRRGSSSATSFVLDNPPQSAPKPAFYATLPRRPFLKTLVATTAVQMEREASNNSQEYTTNTLYTAKPRRTPILSSTYVHPPNTNGESNFSKSKSISMVNLSGGNSEKEMTLIEAAKEGDAEKLKSLLESGANPNLEGSFGHKALHWAIKNNFPECVRMLLEANAKVEDRDYLGKTSVHRAAVLGHSDCLSELLHFGADANAKDNIGNTALHDAASYGNVDCVRVLLQAGASPNEKNEAGETAQGLAVRHDHEECAQVIRWGGTGRGTIYGISQ